MIILLIIYSLPLYSPNFVGSDQSFLFTLRPRMRCFPATNYNDHYQYLNLNQQTMPNGNIKLFLIKRFN